MIRYERFGTGARRRTNSWGQLSIWMPAVRPTRGKTVKREAAVHTKPRISLCLWFDDQGEEAAKFYVSIFKNSRIGSLTRYDEAGAKASGRPKGSVMTVEFELDGH